MFAHRPAQRSVDEPDALLTAARARPLKLNAEMQPRLEQKVVVPPLLQAGKRLRYVRVDEPVRYGYRGLDEELLSHLRCLLSEIRHGSRRVRSKHDVVDQAHLA
ncbi:hypothetical protein [Spirosoma utsteinense]|uniref:Uncharacterized protein n=1 Tax=Spirosoma utsteinense TaxID=2585773 RepID=A0ABR6W724_9BACT|nr:hypothetical protein [Spirosoma utsteinense]MBC3786192.1 hypothetical protein [Spirosoma utsteinense]MBC3792383.1 hypothetical protein [Spirosoma utsteinense]